MDKNIAEKIKIFDTTLRDGEQSPGATMNTAEKITIAKQLEIAKVDIIEAGFPVASPDDFLAVEKISSIIQNSQVAALCRAVKKDIEIGAQSLAKAKSPRIHTFIATSPIHMQYKLKMSEEEVLDNAQAAVKLAKNLCADVEFSAEDACRSDIEFLSRIIEVVIDAGASTINLPDTVGYVLPEEIKYKFEYLISNVPNSDKAIFSCHCHNDLGLASANSLAAITAGARQIECTVNGLGERAGNASLEEVVMAIRTRSNHFNVKTDIDTTQLVNLSRLVADTTGFYPQPNKAIVGINAFAHEAGIHQDGVLKNPDTYEIMRAQDVGWDSNRLVLGKHSGRSAFVARLSTKGIKFSCKSDVDLAFLEFKKIADKQQKVQDSDIVAMINALRAEQKIS